MLLLSSSKSYNKYLSKLNHILNLPIFLKLPNKQMKKSNKLYWDLRLKIATLKGAFPEESSALHKDIKSIEETLSEYRKALREEN